MTRQEEIAKLKARIAELEAMGHWIPQPGEVCEVWDSDERPSFPLIERFHSFGKDGEFFDGETDGSIGAPWKHYAPFSLPGVPWEGGECPVPEDQLVAYEQRDGGRYVTRGRMLNWSHDKISADIVKYWRLAP